jgi:hypothetical protein
VVDDEAVEVDGLGVWRCSKPGPSAPTATHRAVGCSGVKRPVKGLVRMRRVVATRVAAGVAFSDLPRDALPGTRNMTSVFAHVPHHPPVESGGGVCRIEFRRNPTDRNINIAD